MSKIPYTPNVEYSKIPSVDVLSKGKAFLFSITEPNSLTPLYQYALAIHNNPETLSEKYTKNKNTAMTYGGFIEWHWPDELDTISCSASTGAFIHKDHGLMFGDGRRDTIAYQKMLQFLDVFKNNGMVYDAMGTPVIRGRVIMAFDRGMYYGHFTSFSVEESADHSFSFNLSWDFKVERSVVNFKAG